MQNVIAIIVGKTNMFHLMNWFDSPLVIITYSIIWFYETSWLRSNYHRDRFGKLTFRALALRCSLWRKGWRSKSQLSKSFTVLIQPLSTCFIKPNFYVSLSHRHSSTFSLETRNLFTLFLSRALISALYWSNTPLVTPHPTMAAWNNGVWRSSSLEENES